MENILRKFLLYIADSKRLEHFTTHSRITKPVVSKFIAANDLKTTLSICEELAEKNYLSALDYLGENSTTKKESKKAVTSYINILKGIDASKEKDSMNIAIKLTQCGLDISEEYAEGNYRKVLDQGKKNNIFVRVDMEGSKYTEQTIRMIENVYHEYPNTGTVLQSYLYRTTKDVVRLTKLGSRIRMVKGAYLEPKTIAYPNKRDVDKSYLETCKYLLRHGNYPAIATHDEEILSELIRYIHLQGIPKDAFEFQMLYGIRNDLQKKFIDDGYNVRAYVPYGDSWYPYFMRRLAERPANVAFILKNIFRKS